MEEETIDLSEICNDCYKNIKLGGLNSDGDQILYNNHTQQIKWFICFRILFFLDQVHDFAEEPKQRDRNENKNIIEKLYFKLNEELMYFLYNFYGEYKTEVDKLINIRNWNDGTNLKYYRIYGECIQQIFLKQTIKTELNNIRGESINCEKQLVDDHNGNLSDFFEHYTKHSKNVTGLPNYEGASDIKKNLYIYAECCLNIMGIDNKSLKNIKENIYPNISCDFLTTVLKISIHIFSHYNSINIKDILDERPKYTFKELNTYEKDTCAFVDALQENSKLGGLNDINEEIIKRPNQRLYAFKTLVDKKDGAGNNSLYKYIEDKSGNIIEKKNNITFKIFHSYFKKSLKTVPYLFINDKIDYDNIINIKFTTNSVKINNFFSNSSDVPEYKKLTITKSRGLEDYEKLKKQNELLDGKSIQAIFCPKTLMDVSKALYTRKLIKEINQDNYYFISTDRIGGMISSIFLPYVISAVGKEEDYAYISFIAPRYVFNILFNKDQSSPSILSEEESSERSKISDDTPGNKRDLEDEAQSGPPGLKKSRTQSRVFRSNGSLISGGTMDEDSADSLKRDLFVGGSSSQSYFGKKQIKNIIDEILYLKSLK